MKGEKRDARPSMNQWLNESMTQLMAYTMNRGHKHESPGSSRERGAGQRVVVGDYFLLTAFLSSAPAVNFATRFAAILMGLPV